MKFNKISYLPWPQGWHTAESPLWEMMLLVSAGHPTKSFQTRHLSLQSYLASTPRFHFSKIFQAEKYSNMCKGNSNMFWQYSNLKKVLVSSQRSSFFIHYVSSILRTTGKMIYSIHMKWKSCLYMHPQYKVDDTSEALIAMLTVISITLYQSWNHLT